MSRRNNKAAVPQAQMALNNFKNEIASELGIANIVNTQGWANMTSADCGRVGGHMVRKMIEAAEQSLVSQAVTDVKANFRQTFNTAGAATAQQNPNYSLTSGQDIQGS